MPHGTKRKVAEKLHELRVSVKKPDFRLLGLFRTKLLAQVNHLYPRLKRPKM